mgnify:CR=1 FL=1|tara:strand:- start:137 stop:502 length:366 start_codon:yes stop_codon:yes gene_type:complete
MSLLAEAHLVFNCYTYYIYLTHFYDAISLASKINKTRKYILSFIYSAIIYEIEDDWIILEDKEENSITHKGFKKSLQREELIEKDNKDLEEEIRELMVRASSPTFRGQQSIDLPHFVLSTH